MESLPLDYGSINFRNHDSSGTLASYATGGLIGKGAPEGSRNPFLGLRIRRPSVGLQERVLSCGPGDPRRAFFCYFRLSLPFR